MNPDIVILHSAGRAQIEQISDGFAVECLPLEGEKVFVNAAIVVRTLLNISSCSSITEAYALAAVCTINPKLVVTFVDESEILPKLVARCSRTRFLSIQNGIRNLFRDNSDTSKPVMHDHFACFGQAVVDQYELHGASVAHYHLFGSLRQMLFTSGTSSQTPKVQNFDLCLISEADSRLEERWPEIALAVTKLAQYFANFCKETGAKYCIAARNDPETHPREFQFERNFFEEIWGGPVNLLPNKAGTYNSYVLCKDSKVSVSFYSTLSHETFGAGSRVLFCNFSNRQDYDVPIKGVWSLGNCQYNDFELRLRQLLDFTDEDFEELTAKASNYLMSSEADMKSWRNLIGDLVRKAEEV